MDSSAESQEEVSRNFQNSESNLKLESNNKLVVRVKRSEWETCRAREGEGGDNGAGKDDFVAEKKIRLTVFCDHCNHLLEPGSLTCVTCHKGPAKGRSLVKAKYRPFDNLILFTKLDIDKHLQTGHFLKYLKNIVNFIPQYVLESFVLAMPMSELSRSALCGMTYAELVRHLTMLRLDHIQKWVRPVLQKLMAHPKNQNFFNKPVDPVALGIPEYLNIVRNPMDFGTIRSRLQRGLYESAAAVLADVELVFKNATLFNPVDSAVYQAAVALKAECDSEVSQLSEKCAKELEKKSTHACSLCQGACCPLCGEICLKFEPPVLCCNGPCSQRIKRNSIYYVTVDGILVWCLKCYQNLPVVVMEFFSRPPLLKKDLLKRKSDEEVAEPWIHCDCCGHWIHQICALYSDTIAVPQYPHSTSQSSGNADAAAAGQLSSSRLTRRRGAGVSLDDSGGYQCPLCKLEMAAVISSSIESPNQQPTAKKSNLKSEDRNRSKGNLTASTPRRRAMSMLESPRRQGEASYINSTVGKRKRRQSISADYYCPPTGSQRDSISAETCDEVIDSNSKPSPIVEIDTISISNSNSLVSNETVTETLDLANVESEIKIVRIENELVYDQSDFTPTNQQELMQQKEQEGRVNINSSPVTSVGSDDSSIDHIFVASVAHSTPEEQEVGEGERNLSCGLELEIQQPRFDLAAGLSETSSLAGLVNAESAVMDERDGQDNDSEAVLEQHILDMDSKCDGSSSHEMQQDTDDGTSTGAVSCTTDSESLAMPECKEEVNSELGVEGEARAEVDRAEDSYAFMRSEDRDDSYCNAASDATSADPVLAREPSVVLQTCNGTRNNVERNNYFKSQWKASSLPRTKLSDFIEEMVQERLAAMGFESASQSISIRVTSNATHKMDVPEPLYSNFLSREGAHLPTAIDYKQKCILLFQQSDGIDICLFCLYVQEYGSECPPPNNSVVYIAYIDSIDYFRPMEARTLVYHEIVIGYLAWAQARGFKRGHIWACPPQRGDNFIFWCHPPHQRTPSRGRLTQWYNSMLHRAKRIGILSEVSNLWDEYFSTYCQRERNEETQRAAARSSFVNVMGAANGNSSMSSSSYNSSLASESLAHSAITAPVCPPVFEGDYWVTECLRIIRLVQQRMKGYDGQDSHQNHRRCRDLLKHLMSRPWAQPFNQPVDPIALAIPTYRDIVQRPMDLGTVRDGIRAGKYVNMLEFVEDVRLTFSNAMLFNPSAHSVHVMAKQLLKEFETSIVESLSEIGGYPIADQSTEQINDLLAKYPIADKSVSKSNPPAAATLPNGKSMRSTKHKLGLISATQSLSALPSLPMTSPVAAAGIQSTQSSRITRPAHQFHSMDEMASLAITRQPSFCDASMAINNGSASLSNSYSADVDDCCTGFGVDIERYNSMESVCLDATTEVESGAAADTEVGRTITRQDSMDSVYGGLSFGQVWNSRSVYDTGMFNSTTSASSSVGTDADSNSGSAAAAPVDAAPKVVSWKKPQLGTRAAMSMMSDLSKSVMRLKDDLFVIKFGEMKALRTKSMFLNSKKGLEEGVTRQEIKRARSVSCVSFAGLDSVQEEHFGDSNDPNDAMDDDASSVFTDALGSQPSIASSSKSKPGAISKPCLASATVTAAAAMMTASLGSPNSEATSTTQLNKDGTKRRGRKKGSSNKAKSASGSTLQPATAKRVTCPIIDDYAEVGGSYISDRAMCMLSTLEVDTSDPDVAMSSKLVDSRHTFLEMCQYRHFQFDSLRRAKHSSMMLLYYLHNSECDSLAPICSHCSVQIRDVRWHCDLCPNLDFCADCNSSGCVGGKITSSSISSIHQHILTPFRVTYA